MQENDEERREQISKLVWIGITVVGTVLMGFFMLRNEMHALISENEPATAPVTPGQPAPPAPPPAGQ
ncbi:hypothetical protein [Komagataeibacter nataicola]|nr:hypothetical protein [Komagataeibacter nataicola]WNM08042.1 hypothetical protein RI056_13960 [Komagataeibacter nataicola]GBR22055.1 hypothetical protein AA0616_2180 [Komagataeibacter nataicola NRIC 0616]